MEVIIIMIVLSSIGIVCSLTVFFIAFSEYKRCDRMLKRIEEYERDYERMKRNVS